MPLFGRGHLILLLISLYLSLTIALRFLGTTQATNHSFSQIIRKITRQGRAASGCQVARVLPVNSHQQHTDMFANIEMPLITPTEVSSERSALNTGPWYVDLVNARKLQKH